jgi:hypothetical protein
MSSVHNGTSGKLDAWEVVKTTFALYRKYIGFVLLGGIVLLGSSFLLRSIFQQWSYVASIISIALQSVVFVLFLRYIAAHESGHKISLSELAQSSSKFIFPGVVISLVVYGLVSLGLFLLIIPGLIIGILFSQSFALVVLEGKGIKAALTLSRSLTKGNRLNIFHAYWGTYVPVIALIVLVFLLFFGSNGMQSPYVPIALTVFTGMVLPIITFVIYRALKKLH